MMINSALCRKPLNTCAQLALGKLLVMGKICTTLLAVSVEVTIGLMFARCGLFLRADCCIVGQVLMIIYLARTVDVQATLVWMSSVDFELLVSCAHAIALSMHRFCNA